MFRSIFFYLKIIFTLVFSFPMLNHAKKLKKKGLDEEFDEYSYSVTTDWSKKILNVTGSNITVHNSDRIPKDQNVVFISNHQSDFDILLFMGSIPKNTGFVAKIELAKIPLLSKWMHNIHCVFMDRADLKQSLKTITEAISLAKSGYSLVIFPEGTRSKSDKLGEFKAGSFKIATKSKVPIVPITLDGSHKVVNLDTYKVSPEDVNIYVHEPIYVNDLTKEEIANLPETVKDLIASKLPNNGK